ncbi:unnamed protein product, partial [Symbiodinium pilosum]
ALLMFTPSGISTGIQVADGFSSALMLVTGGIFGWLSSNARAVYHEIMRWWGGPTEWRQIWEDYKKSRSEIMKQETHPDTRSYLISDLRQEFRDNYPQWAHKWN